ERAGGHRLDVHRLHVFAEPHDRALAEAALDLGERGIESFRFVHGRSFDETKRCCTHVRCSLWPGFDGLTTDAPNGSPGVLPLCSSCGDGKKFTFFVLGSQFVFFGVGPGPFPPPCPFWLWSPVFLKTPLTERNWSVNNHPRQRLCPDAGG